MQSVLVLEYIIHALKQFTAVYIYSHASTHLYFFVDIYILCRYIYLHVNICNLLFSSCVVIQPYRVKATVCIECLKLSKFERVQNIDRWSLGKISCSKLECTSDVADNGTKLEIRKPSFSSDRVPYIYLCPNNSGNAINQFVSPYMG